MYFLLLTLWQAAPCSGGLKHHSQVSAFSLTKLIDKNSIKTREFSPVGDTSNRAALCDTVTLQGSRRGHFRGAPLNADWELNLIL